MEAIPLPAPAKILLWDKRLRDKPCDPVLKFDSELAAFAKVLESTCYVNNAVGLAAPQIGDFRRIALVHYPQDAPAFVMVNPVIDEINSKGEQIDFESCLSLPCCTSSGSRLRGGARVRRCRDIVYSYQDLSGKRIEAKASDMLARVIAHEYDHLFGIYYIDRISSVTRDFVLRDYSNFARRLSVDTTATARL